MSKALLKLRLKVAVATASLATGLWPVKFPINLAENEVLLLHAVKCIINRTASGGWESRVFLYKKTENVPAVSAWSVHHGGKWEEDKSLLDSWFYVGNSVRTAEGLQPEPMFYQVYPMPMILVRPPSMLTYGTAGTTASLALWYTTVKVSSKDLTELLMKDHA